jgi:hypothetical protein
MYNVIFKRMFSYNYLSVFTLKFHLRFLFKKFATTRGVSHSFFHDSEFFL